LNIAKLETDKTEAMLYMCFVRLQITHQ